MEAEGKHELGKFFFFFYFFKDKRKAEAYMCRKEKVEIIIWTKVFLQSLECHQGMWISGDFLPSLELMSGSLCLTYLCKLYAL